MLEPVATITMEGTEFKLYPLNMGRARQAAKVLADTKSQAGDLATRPDLMMEAFSKVVALAIQRGMPDITLDIVDVKAEGSQQEEIMKLAQIVLRASGFNAVGNPEPTIPASAETSGESGTGTESTQNSSSPQAGPGNT